MNDLPRNDRPLSGLYSAFDAATQVAAEAFAAGHGANVTATLTIPGRKRSSRWPTSEVPPSIEGAIEGYAAAMVDAYGVDRASILVSVRFVRGQKGESTPFYRATLSADDPNSELPSITVQAWRSPESETFVARERPR